MLKRIFYHGLIASIVQVGVYLLLLYGVKYILEILTEDKYILLDDFGIQLSVTLLAMIVVVQNIIVAAVNLKWFTWIAFALVSAFYFLGWGENYNTWPERTLVYLAVGLLVLLGKLKIDLAAKPTAGGKF